MTLATGSISISATLPSLNLGGANGNAAGASQALANTLIQQAAQQIGATGATSGNLVYPPGSATVVGSFTYSPST
jgi:hypothetical protein